MKALIFNSGMGSRLGRHTLERPKCMVRLSNGESIFHRQLRILMAHGITEFIVTTGPFADQIEEEARPFQDEGCTFEFVRNPRYKETNYIYSMHLAREFLHDDAILMLHGDLVFDSDYITAVMDSPLESLGSVNASLDLPLKDFKARVVDGEVREVSVKIFDEGCVAFQPLYKLSQNALRAWLLAVERFVEDGDVDVYAENAANCVFEGMGVKAFSYAGHFVEEVDTPDDLMRVSAAIREFDFAQQPVFEVSGKAASLVEGCSAESASPVFEVAEVLASLAVRNPLVVATSHIGELGIAKVLLDAGIPCDVFTEFDSNPTYENVAAALDAFVVGGHDSLISIGGGSAIDVAKCVKQFAVVTPLEKGALSGERLPYSPIPHVAVPTTAGTGSESTHFAVCYVDGRKISVSNDCLMPEAALLDASNVSGLSDYQKKCTMLDALCQAIESYWSKRSSKASRLYSSLVIDAISGNAKAYLQGDSDAARAILRAANRAGKAINLTTTTAPHAMSYKLTSLYGVPHGHAVALCMPGCWRALLERGDTVTQERLEEIARLLGAANAREGLNAYLALYKSLCMPEDWRPAGCEGLDHLDLLVESVNAQRLANFPVELNEDEVRDIYRGMLSRCQ